MSSETVAIVGFLVLFSLMLLRVPVGMAMGLVGVGGFIRSNGGSVDLTTLCDVKAGGVLLGLGARLRF